MMLSNQASAFLRQHKRRRYASDRDFVARMFRQLGVQTVKHLLDFQETFGGYVSPTNRGQFVWELTSRGIPSIKEHCGVWSTPCSNDPRHGPRIDTNGCLHTVGMTCIATSCFLFFEQLALIWQWHEKIDTGEILKAVPSEVNQFRSIVLPDFAEARVDDVSDRYSQVYATDTCLILDRCDVLSVWFIRDGMPSEALALLKDTRTVRLSRRFVDRFRSLFCDRPNLLTNIVD